MTPCEDDGDKCTKSKFLKPKHLSQFDPKLHLTHTDGSLTCCADYCESGNCLAVPITCPLGESCDSLTGLCAEINCADENLCTYDVYDVDALECKHYNIDCSVIDQECSVGACNNLTG